ncbi:MAG TPA: hypothetical protein VKH81_24215 [Candidatus Angelobacter sp.]|nr:hypothetical protein [Candidatus Angelobacter sp.]
MKRSIFGFLGGLFMWVLVATVLNRLLRLGFPGYTLAEPAMAFTLGMKIARLTLAVLASLAAGATTAWIAPRQRILPWILGAVILAMFLPVHVQIWAKFPAWYHLFFLGTLVPLVGLGASLIRKKDGSALQTQARLAS